MTKKNSRSKTKAAAKPAAKPIEVEEAIEEVAPVAATTPRLPKVAKMNRSQVAAERIEDEYAYITDDLRRVFILAAALFALLIVANIVLGLM